jgi:hypothetical protein
MNAVIRIETALEDNERIRISVYGAMVALLFEGFSCGVTNISCD